MEPIDLLLSRKSHNKLIAPAPSDSQLDLLFKSALRAPDHALLKPWRYRVYQGSALNDLGEMFAQAAQLADTELSQEKLDKLRLKPLRAPMVVIASVIVKEHPKVPVIEQFLSAAAGVQNLLVAAHFEGIGAMWRTGSMAYNKHLMKLLELEQDESIIGFIYLGTETGNKREAKPVSVEDYVTRFE